MEDTGAFPQLARLVPAPNQKVGGGIEDTLNQADQEADGDDLIAAARSGEAERQDRPYQLTAWDPYRRSDFGENKLGRQLSDDISGGPCHVYQVQLVRVHGQILLHAGHVCIGNVCLVQILDEVSEAEDRQERNIEFLDEFPLFGSPRRFIILGKPLGLIFRKCR